MINSVNSGCRHAGRNIQFFPFHLPFINNGNIFNQSNNGEFSTEQYRMQSDDPVSTGISSTIASMSTTAAAMSSTTAESLVVNKKYV